MSSETLVHSLSERALLAIARGDWSLAGTLAEEAHDASRQASIENALVCAVRARVALHRGDLRAVKQELVSAQRVRPLLTSALPYFAVQARIELARVRLGLTDVAGARTLMAEVDGILRRRPGLGTLVAEAETLRSQLAKERGPSAPGASALTGAELRLLPLLATYLPVREIAAELVLSPHTIKSRMKSIYRKLDASTRSEAVNRARELGLLEG